MGDAEVPPFWELDYTGDFRLYQHPPCMFILWWVGLAVNAGWEAVKKLIDEYFGDGSESGGKDDEGEKQQDDEEGKGDEEEEGGGEGGGDDAAGGEGEEEEGEEGENAEES